MTQSDSGNYEFIATIEREMFYNNGWGTYRFTTDAELPNATPSYDINNNLIYLSSLTGNMQQLEVGMEYKVSATIQNHSKYGFSYSPIRVEGTIPQTIETQHKFLESIFTPTQAKTILRQYPNIVQDIIDNKDNVDFKKLKGITESKWDDLRRKVVDNFVISDILAYLAPLGVSLIMIQKMCDSEKNPALLKQKLEENPYMLVNIPTIGFKKADIIAKKLQPDLVISKFRSNAYINYLLKEVGNDNGHSWIEIEELKTNFINNVPECIIYFDEIINEQRNNPTYLNINGSTVGLRKRYEKERFIWDKIYDMNNYSSEYVISDEIINRGIEISNSFQGFQYDDEQVAIINNVVKTGGVQVITGKAGVGKTSISRGVLNVYKKAGLKILTCALSARAGIVITESTGFESSTIHRMLGAKGSNYFTFNETCSLDVDVLMIDEMSMVNVDILESVLKALHPKVTLLLVGDGKQLPPIGYGNVFNDIIDAQLSPLCHVNYLKTIYRQALDSGIIKDANIIRDNKYPFDKITSSIVSGVNKDMVYKFFDDKENIHNMALKVYLKAVESDGIDSVTILCPRKDNCLNSTETFNSEIQNYILGKDSPSYKYGNTEFKVGAKVMQIKNDYSINIMNGEVGYVTSLEKNGCKIKFKDDDIMYKIGKSKKELNGELKDITLAYATTVHKMQGSSINTVIGVLDTSHYTLLDSTLLYTLITRAKKRCMLISQPNAFKQCIHTSHSIDRNTYMELFKKRSNALMQIPLDGDSKKNTNSESDEDDEDTSGVPLQFELEDLLKREITLDDLPF